MPLRFIAPNQSGGTTEFRDICPVNLKGPPLETLPEADCWTLGPFEARLRAIQQQFRGDLRRLSLRTLFARNRPRTKRRCRSG